MSIRTKNVAAIATTVIAALAVTASAIVGLTGWPLPRASAATTTTQVLGVDANTAVVVGPEVTTSDKFSTLATTTVSGPGALLGTVTARKAVPVTRVSLVEHNNKVAARIAAEKAAELKAKKAAAKAKAKAAAAKKAAAKKKKWKTAKVSWYGPGLYGNGMAGGGKLKKNSMVVAHRSLPFGTKVEFKYKGRTVVATVKDRGPYISGRKFDLGPGIAKKLKFSGVHQIKYRIVKRVK